MRKTGVNVPQLHGRTDDEGRFTVTFDTLKMTIEGLAEDAWGEVIRKIPTQILLEPRPGIAEIQGVGNIGSVWVGLYGYEWKRVTRSGFKEIQGTASGVEIDLGQVVVRPRLTWRCNLPHEEVVILGEAGDQHVTLVSGTCTAELTFEIDPTKWLQHAKRVAKLPRTVGPSGTWVVVESRYHDVIRRTLYQSDGRVWVEHGTKEMLVVDNLNVMKAIEPALEDRREVIVHGHVYRWDRPDPSSDGWWTHLGEWMPVKEEAPTEEPAEPGEPGGSGEPSEG